MIPSVLSQYLRQGVEDFLRTTFPISTPAFHRAFDDLLGPDGKIFKGPYLKLQLPFREGEGGPDFFPDVPLKFRPYLHQERAFRRLSGSIPKSTIVATGTGSGKTECFLYPILDYCCKHRHEPGIKTIIIYPMNALASDQAGRIAKIIYNNTNLKGAVTAGLYVGQKTENPMRVMTADNVITDRETQRLSPPDILLTNYKMLDYLLIRPEDAALWSLNAPESLKFVVVDELHTFDGAQGTDLACLMRRLKARLGSPQGHICCVGTSATLGGKEDRENLVRYAEQLFGEAFESDSIITESTLSASEFLQDSEIETVDVVPFTLKGQLNPQNHASYPEYLRAQHALWFREGVDSTHWDKKSWRVRLGERIKSSVFFRNLLAGLDGATRDYNDIISDLSRAIREMADGDEEYGILLLNSFLALISEARSFKVKPSDGGKDRISAEDVPVGPFLNVRLQLWLRELRRMVANVGKEPGILFADDLTEAQSRTTLPIIHCRECGVMGWAGVKRQSDPVIDSSLKGFYTAFFHNDHKVRFLFPEENIEVDDSIGDIRDLCSDCLRLSDIKTSKTCVACGSENLVRVFVPHSNIRVEEKTEGSHDCPYCNAKNSLTIVGSQAASLTSVLIAQLFSSGFNDDKKLLAFSDSVQDAAHRAGFFAARTYRFNFRTALQKYVTDVGQGQKLSEAPSGFADYWRNQMDMKTYVATFLAPQMEWFPDYDYLKHSGRLPDDSQLIDDINRRISWEIFAEYGFNCRIGRTLEKTGSSAAHVDSASLNRASNGLLEILRNEIGGLRELDETTLKMFLLGVINNLKSHGAIAHDGLRDFMFNHGGTYVINRVLNWMPPMSQNARIPVFLTNRPNTRFSQITGNFAKTRTWHQDWAWKAFFPTDHMIASSTDHLYKLVIENLTSFGILNESTAKSGSKVWGLNPDTLRLSLNPRSFKCAKCGHNMTADVSEAGLWEGSPCMRYRCGGNYSLSLKGKDYYGTLYATGDVNRIFSSEHTGLLKRDDRERLESRFKSGSDKRDPWDPNLLSCTPTLEMGIDIGDLSSVILCSVPPTQANYLQRVGRSGRTDGNALNTTIANAKPHDLFFYADPLEMISGNVDTPGVFLNASAVLERQLTAYCFDNWVASGITEAALPKRMGKALNNLDKPDDSKFPFNLLKFISTGHADLLPGFIKLFEGSLSEESQIALKGFISGNKATDGSLPWKILNGIQGRKSERDSLRKKLRTLSEKIRKKEKNPEKGQHHKLEIEELEQEKEGISGVLTSIRDQNTFNFMTDEGLLPNYAFPEAGVTLRSVIYRKKRQSAGNKGLYDSWTEQYQRSAVSAIEDLAPGSTFYAGGRKVKIDQVDVSLSETTAWRLCENCSYSEQIGIGEETDACPNCGNRMWPDEGRKKQMIRIRQVFATSADKSSRISDDSDEREPRFFNKRMLTSFDPVDITGAYQIKNEELPFGFEFVRKATFREINFGEGSEESEGFKVAGKTYSSRGFRICKVCGKVQSNKKEIKHSWTCTARDQESDANLTDCIYLYREFTTEAVRILLPETTFSGSNRTLHSFVAALNLGLKKYFKGRIDHLQTTDEEEPIPESSFRKKILVLYDTVPGGTGYLKDLMKSSKPLMDVFRLALETLQACSCGNDPSRDGCYRCLLAYRRSYRMAETSRNVAIKLLSEIIANEDNIATIKSISQITTNNLTQSELETRFLKLFSEVPAGHEIPMRLTKELVNKKTGYILNIGDHSYSLEPQVNLGSNDNVGMNCSADFILRSRERKSPDKPIALFLDGYQYHKDRIGKDLAQRMFVNRSGKFLAWSLTWRDVEQGFNPAKAHFGNYLTGGDTARVKQFHKWLTLSGLEKFIGIETKSSLQWLTLYLANTHKDAKPQNQAAQRTEELWAKVAYFCALGYLNLKPANTEKEHQAWSYKAEEALPPGLLQVMDGIGQPSFCGLFEPEHEDLDKPVRMFVMAAQESIRKQLADDVYMVSVLSDDMKNLQTVPFVGIWAGFLRLQNLLQFLPNAFFLTSGKIKEGYYDNISSLWKDAEPVESTPLKDAGDWEKVLKYFPNMKAAFETLSHLGWSAPDSPYELVDSTGTVVAQANFAWENRKVAILNKNEEEFLPQFESAGWRVVSQDSVIANPNIL